MIGTATLSPIRFSEQARKEIERLQKAQVSDASKKLRVGIKGGGCSGMTYILEFDVQKENDMVLEDNGVEYIMSEAHEIYLFGMTIHWEGGLNSRGFTFSNPNASKTCGCGTSFAV